MMLTITGNRMVLHNHGMPLADATLRPGWQVGCQRPAGPSGPRSGDHRLDRHRTLACGHSPDHPPVVTFRNELA